MKLLKNHKNYRKTSQADLVLIFFIFTRLIAIFFSYPAISDINLYHQYYLLAQDSKPYQDFNFEYPLFSLLIIYLPTIISNSLDLTQYYTFFAIFLLLADYICLFLCQKLCRNQLNMNQEQINYMALLYSLLGLLLFKILYHRLDLIVALIFTISIFTYKSQFKSLFINNFVGLFYKISPAFLMPCAIIAKSKERDNPIKFIIINSLLFLSTLIALIYILELYTQGNFIKNMLYHQERGIQIESTYSSFLLLYNLTFNIDSYISHGYGAFNIEAPKSLVIISKYLGFVILLGFYASLLFLKTKISLESFIEITLIAILTILCFQRVFSPQFLIWMIPVSAIYLAKNRSIFLLITFLSVFFLTFLIFSIDYMALVNQEPILVFSLIIRNFILIILNYYVVRNFFRKLK